ncbi:E3 ubiquitin-protein ligase TRIM39-like [Scomber japonicus]|uniref:E3 ubiquitin-protein ligase TRIM39-like n=1 Tax=Scomber japonicus TaxID=13676 RepID=UPI0023059370|nr:E3 ubiquitin-protein ligase TRIM39-like [Scomber japonicus]
MASALSEDQLQCSICLDVFNNPTSLPCGHNFCLDCIKQFWVTRRHKPAECPLCKETFKKRPELRINIDLKDITEQFQRSLKDKPRYKPTPVIPSNKDITCDVCHEIKSTAVKSCVVCQESYCVTHLISHLRDPVMTKHRLMDPYTFVNSHMCSNHRKPLEIFCRNDQTPLCAKCVETDHKYHKVLPIEKECSRIKTQMQKIEAEFQQMIQDRNVKIEEIKNSVEMSKKIKEEEIHKSLQVFTMMISAIESNQALLIEELEKKQEAAEKKAQEFVSKLEQEINELQRRCNELVYLGDSNDTLHLLQSFPSLSAPLCPADWSGVTVHSDNYIGTVRRTCSKLVDICQEFEKKLSAVEVSKTNQYAVDVTLDPDTAAGWLILSPDGKKVSVSSQQRKLPENPGRFDSCVSVLGKQSFTFGRRYWVVQVGDKTDWDLGVARESINRKGAITVRPDSGYWAICRRKGGSLSACAGPSVTLHLQETPQKVGIFLDIEEGEVSFYDAETKTHIYTYAECTFTEALYPYLNPCLHDNGKNTAPLIICPVLSTEETVEF